MKKILIIFVAISALVVSSCDNYLDTMPDNRTTLNTPEKITNILVNAYPIDLPIAISEAMSDNCIDNGSEYSNTLLAIKQAYFWDDIPGNSFETPYRTWRAAYNAISNANHAIQAIEELGRSSETDWNYGEALMCRAYGHFVIATTFCRAYADKTKNDYGIPYARVPETELIVKYDRGTLEQTYENIKKDIELGLPLIDDKYAIPKYHFNKRAANAFAARFYLYYRDYEKVIEHANNALGTDPKKYLRDLEMLRVTSDATERFYMYIDHNVPANFLMTTSNSIWGYVYAYSNWARYMHSGTLMDNETFKSPGPWEKWGFTPNGYDHSILKSYDRQVYSANQFVTTFFPKCMLIETEQTEGGGMTPRGARAEFTADETLLARAEAYVMTKQYDLAVEDLSTWYILRNAGIGSYTKEDIISFYRDNDKAAPMRLDINPDFTVEDGDQLYLLYAVLHARRIETMHDGLRWQDLKRYGVRVTHIRDNDTPLVLEPYDLRTAVQIPTEATSEGLPANPR